MNTDIIITRKAIKHLYLRINAQGQVQVSAPNTLSDNEIKQFIRQKQHWIKKHQRQRLSKTQVAPRHKADEASFLFFGKIYPINKVIGKKNSVMIKEGTLLITLGRNSQTTIVPRLLKDFRKLQLLELVHQYVVYYEPIIGVYVNEVRTKQMKTRWATCNITAKRLWFNLALTKWNKKCIEYAVVHEMTHLLERYHNPRFYRLVESAMPDWQQWHELLRS